MSKKLKLFLLIAGLLFINIAGFLLKYFELDTFFIFIGFRFHFSIVIFSLFALKFIDFTSVKVMFIHPSKQNYILLLLIAFIPLLILPLDMFVLEKFNLSEQDYFFELGLSSVIDYPVYLIWNTPQLFIYFILMNTIFVSPGFIKIALVTFFLFLFEFIPINILNDSETVNYITIVDLVLIVLLTGLMVLRTKNIYLFTLITFTVLWGAVLFFGSSSNIPVNILLASQYESWNGLLNPGSRLEYSNYLLSVYIFILFIVSTFALKKTESSLS